MNDKLSISYHAAKLVLLELLENNDFFTDEDIMKLLGSKLQKENCARNDIKDKTSRIVIDKFGRIFLPEYSSMEVKMPYLPKTVFIFFLIHAEGIEFKSMHNYIQELYDIYQVVALEKNTEAGKIKRSLENLVEPVNNRIYETCSIIRRTLSMVVPAPLMDLYCIKGKRGGEHRICIGREMLIVENDKLTSILNNRSGKSLE